MKLIDQQSDNKWTVIGYGAEVFARTREHRLTLLEAVDEMPIPLMQGLVASVNSEAYGGIDARHLLCLDCRFTREASCWRIEVALQESTRAYNQPLKLLNTETGNTFEVDCPLYRVNDYRNWLPTPKPFEAAEGDAI